MEASRTALFPLPLLIFVNLRRVEPAIFSRVKFEIYKRAASNALTAQDEFLMRILEG